MLCLNNNWQAIDGNHIRLVDITREEIETVKEDGRIALFDREDFSINQIKQSEVITDNSSRLTVEKDFEGYTDIRISNCIFGNGSKVFFEEDFLKKLPLLSRALKNKPVLLNIKAKKGFYLRFIYADTLKNDFIESYLDWKDYEKVEKELLNMKNGVDSCIKNKRMEDIQSYFSAMREILEKLLQKTGIPITGNRSEYLLLSILWSNTSLFLPFEILSDRILVRYFMPSSERFCKKAGNHFTMIYSSSMKTAVNEVYKIKEILNKRFNVEYFPESNFSDYKTNLRDSSFIHFSGHGEIVENRGKIELQGSLTDEILYCGNVKMAILNCCVTGLYSEGIVSFLLKEGADAVLASPYEIIDSDNNGGFGNDSSVVIKLTEIRSPDILCFYNFFNPDDLEMSYLLTSIKNQEFTYFYRFCGKYTC